ncbi:recombinase family protein [Corynebacterium frankenforstense]|uniref:recombinase family protein n=1 Tax=Corynebacterium frankenforstense TaxID=1230998 RepID=UPI00095337BC
MPLYQPKLSVADQMLLDLLGRYSPLDRPCVGYALVVTKLDRLARSVAGAHATAREIEATDVRLQVGADTYDLAGPMGALMFKMVATIAQLKADLISVRTEKGMEVARQRGHSRGIPPKLMKRQGQLVKEWPPADKMSYREVVAAFGVSASTITRTNRHLIEAGELDPDDLQRTGAGCHLLVHVFDELSVHVPSAS